MAYREDGNVWNTTPRRAQARDLAQEITGEFLEFFQNEDEALEYYRELREDLFWDLS